MNKLKWLVLPALSLTLAAQTAPARRSSAASRQSQAPAVTSDDIRALRDALAEQQRQIQQLRQELQRRDQAMDQQEQKLNQLQTATRDAQSKAGAASEQSTEGVSKLQGDVSDLKLNQTNAAVSTQDDQKRIGAVEGLVNRFRLSGDVRVRYENFFQRYDGCIEANCPQRHRARIRLRLGIDGKLNEDFIGALYLATGTNVNATASFTDPVSTNQTLTEFYDRKTIGLDRGYISYQPQRWKWLQLTGGKFAYPWIRTPMTFDNDLNPEGFFEKFSFDFGNPIVKSVTFTGMQLLFNEISGIGNDGNAIGGQLSSKLQVGRLVTMTPAITILNWNGADAIAQAAFPVLPCASATATGCIPNPNTPAVGTPLPPPITPAVRLINANAFTNASRIVGTGTGQRRAFVSGFEYAEALLDTNVQTPFKRFPWRILLNFEKNLRAKTPVGAPSRQDQAYWLETSIGQQRDKNDLQFGYSFARVEQDALISQFNESDMRAATNVLQHRVFFGWQVQRNVQIALTHWLGRTLNVNLQNAAKPAGLPAGQQDPWLNRSQFDVVYRF